MKLYNISLNTFRKLVLLTGWRIVTRKLYLHRAQGALLRRWELSNVYQTWLDQHLRDETEPDFLCIYRQPEKQWSFRIILFYGRNWVSTTKWNSSWVKEGVDWQLNNNNNKNNNNNNNIKGSLVGNGSDNNSFTIPYATLTILTNVLLTLYALTSVCLFFILFSIHFLGLCQPSVQS